MKGLYRSFPIQLLLLHLRTNILLLLIWLILACMISGVIGGNLGVQYLFLDPEYLGRPGYLPFLLLGLAFGFFTMSWNLSTYLLLGRQFPFLATLARPFLKWCINNAGLPLLFLLVYCVQLGRFLYYEGAGMIFWESLTGLLLGLMSSLFLYALYFNYTNRDISYYQPALRGLPPNRGPALPVVDDGDTSVETTNTAPSSTNRRSISAVYSPRGLENPHGVVTYLTGHLRPRLVRSVAHYDGALLRGIFRQNHMNALLLQMLSIIVLGLLGLLIDYPLFQIPAGASFFILFSLAVAIVGAVSYWFAEWRVVLLTLLLVLLDSVTSGGWFNAGNRAYGLDYETPAATYNSDVLRGLYGSDRVEQDIAATLEILEHWKAKQPGDKPPFVIVCASGGGLTAALWTTHVVQALHERSGNRLLPATALMTGASGGQIGLALLREHYLSEPDFNAGNHRRLAAVSRDLLNPVAFSVVSNDLFLPFTRVDVAGRTYPRDRAYNFEQALNRHTGGVLDKPLRDYREPERRAAIPLMFVTPSVVEDGRRLVISPQGVSYLTAPPAALNGTLDLRPDMIDFRWLLAEQDADELRFTTALRAAATYPFILPLVRLPTQPTIRLMDAGYRDNYGVTTAARFVTVFQDWLAENTSGVHLIQVTAFSDKDRHTANMDDRRGVVESLFSPVGLAGNILSTQILDQETVLGQLAELLGPERFHLYRFNYQPGPLDPLKTTISFHLTERERRLVLRGLDKPGVQAELEEVLEVFASQYSVLGEAAGAVIGGENKANH